MSQPRMEIVRSAEDYAEVALREHALVVQAGEAFIDHAIKAGEALLAARQQVPHGQWIAWLTPRWEGSIAVAQKYMRVARHKKKVLEQRPAGMREALRLLHEGRDTRVDPDEHAECMRLHAQGLRQIDIAKQLGIPKQRVQRWLNPEYQEKVKAKNRQTTLAGRRALAQQERARHAKQAGGPIAESYALVRKTLGILDRAADAENDPDVKAHLRAAIGRLHRAEDEIVRASKIT